MSANYRHRSTCRLCESRALDLAFKLNPSPPVDSYVTQSQLREEQECFPMDLYLCRSCGHAQLLDVVSPALLFGNYIYTTTSAPGLVEYFQDYAQKVCARLQPRRGSLVVDIGSNDGTLLAFFKERGLTVLGVDPATDIAMAATQRGMETLPEFFDSRVAGDILRSRGVAAIVTANNVFAHADNLGDMADGIRTLLSPDGVFVFEVSYLLDMLNNMVFDFIYHEHLSHHSVKPLKRFLRQHELHLFGVERTPSKGGTIRCFAQLVGGSRPEHQDVERLIKLEEDAKLYSIETLR